MKLSNRFFIAIALFVFALATAQDAIAAHMYATGRTNGNSDTALLEIGDSSPFPVSTVSTVSGVRLNGIDFVPGTNTLYGTSGGQGANPGSLFLVNLAAGTTTLRGPTGVTTGVGQLTDLAFGLDGTLYGTEYETLYSLNLASGLASPAPNPFGFGNIESIAVDPTSGILYGMTWDNVELYTINPSTGVATSVGVFADLDTAIPGVGVTGFGIDYSGNFFVSTGSQDGQIFSLDVPTLGHTLLVDAFAGSVSDIAFVPEPTGIALALLGLTFCTRIRRKR